MGTTITKLRAVVDATSVDEGAQKLRNFGQTTSQVSTFSSQALGRVSSVLRGDFTGALVGLGAAAGVVTAGVAIGKVALSMDDMRQRAANVRKELTAYAGGATQARDATEAMLRATDGGISRVDAMSNASRLLGMGFATTSQQVYELSRMATMLGDKTLGVTDRMASFNAMLANQSIERLDTFGISSGRVRARIEELQAVMPGLSREQAFVNAVLEIGGQKLKDVEAAGVDAATSVDKLNAALANLKQSAADKIHIQVAVDRVAEGIDNAAYWMSDEGENERRYAAAFEDYRVAVERAAQAQADLGQWYANVTPLARVNYENKLQEAQAAEAAALAEYRIAQSLMNSAGAMGSEDDAARQYTRTMQDSVPAALAAAAAIDEHALALQRATLARGAYMSQRGQKYLDDREAARREEGSYGAQLTRWAQPREEASGPNAVQQWITRMENANKTIARSTGTRMSDVLTDAARNFEGALKNALQAGQNFSIGLKDFRPGGTQGPNAPGQNGAFEDIYRLQAWLNDGTWSETAAKYGKNREDLMQRVQKFQSGMWDKSVMELIDTKKLTEQIQQAQLGKQMMDAVATDLAKASGADPKIIQAMLGMGGAGNGAALKIDMGGQLVPALTTAIDAELLARSADLGKRGEAAWELIEGGMLSKARRSTGFVTMVEGMVDNALANYVPRNR